MVKITKKMQHFQTSNNAKKTSSYLLNSTIVKLRNSIFGAITFNVSENV